MGKSWIVCGALFILIAAEIGAFRPPTPDGVTAKIQGIIIIKDDKGNRFFLRGYSLPMSVKVLRDQLGNRSCPGDNKVSNKLEFEAILDKNCLTDCRQNDPLYLKVVFPNGQPAGWVTTSSLPNIFYNPDVSIYSAELEIRVPSVPSVTSRTANFELGKKVFDTSPEAALSYFSEAVRNLPLDHKNPASDYKTSKTLSKDSGSGKSVCDDIIGFLMKKNKEKLLDSFLKQEGLSKLAADKSVIR